MIVLTILGKDDLNTPVSDCVVVSSEIAVQPETSMTAASGSDQAGENGSTRQEERNKSSTNNNQNCTHQSPYAENNYCSTSGVQGSGIPVANPLQLENSLQEPAPDELFPEEDPLPCPPPTSQLPAIVDEQNEMEEDPCRDRSLNEADGGDHDEQMDSLSNLVNENVHQVRSADQPIKPKLLTQNSCYDEGTGTKVEEGKILLTNVYQCNVSNGYNFNCKKPSMRTSNDKFHNSLYTKCHKEWADHQERETGIL